MYKVRICYHNLANNNKSVLPLYYSNLHKHLNHRDQCTHLQKAVEKEEVAEEAVVEVVKADSMETELVRACTFLESKC